MIGRESLLCPPVIVIIYLLLIVQHFELRFLKVAV